MAEWSLTKLLADLHDEIQDKLRKARESIGHPSAMGDESERVWLKLLQDYLPARYQAESAFVVDSEGNFSQQIDVVVFDRQYSPFIFRYETKPVIPAESVYAVFEAKQTLNAAHVEYAHKKIASVRRLHRTSLPIPHAGGTFPAKPLIHIIGGILTFESEWIPPFGSPLHEALRKGDSDSQIDIGCVAAHGHFLRKRGEADHTYSSEGRPATAFLLNLIAELQFSGTVPMIDVQAYARWLAD